MRIRAYRFVAAVVAAAFFTSLSPVFAQTSTTTTTQINGPGGETGTQTVTTTQNADGTTTTTTTTNVSGPITNGQPGATYYTDNDTTTVVTQGTREISRHEEHNHYNWDKKGGKVIGSTTRTWDEKTNWTTGVRTVTSDTLVVNGSTDTTTHITYSSEWTWFGAAGGHFEQTGGHQTVRKQHDDDPPERSERSFDGTTGKWTDFHTISQLFPATPQVGGGNDTENVYLASAAGPSSEIVATVEDPTQDGPVDEVTVQVQDAHGHSHLFDAFTDPDGHIDFRLPSYATALALFTHFTRDEHPDDAAAHCVVNAHGIVDGTDAVTNAPQTGPAIERASSAYERGGAGRDLFAMQTRDVDPLHARVLVDGSAEHAQVVAASDMETVGRFDDSLPLGRHTFSVKSGSTTSNAFPADVVALRADPLGVTETGSVQTVIVHVDGLPASDSGTMYFQVGGAAVLADGGGSTTAVAVQRGIAQVRIRGVHAGPALVRFHLHAEIAGFWT